MAQHDCVGFIASASMTGTYVLMQGRINIGYVEAAKWLSLLRDDSLSKNPGVKYDS